MAGMRRRLRTDRHDPAWTDLVCRQKNAGNMWREVNNAIGAGTHDHDAEWQYFYVLLEFKIAVERYKYFAYAVRAAQSAGKFPSSNIRICRNSFVSRVEHCYGEFALYRWKLVQKLIKALAAFKVIEIPDYRFGVGQIDVLAKELEQTVPVGLLELFIAKYVA